MYRIAHLSDTHVSPEYARQNISRLRVLLAVIVEHKFDHVVLTGDITATGEARDYRSVRRLLDYFGLLSYERLSVTVGNHDIFGGVHRAEDLFTFRRRCRAVSYEAKMRTFERAFVETFPKKALRSQKLFPFVKLVGPVALAGINSIRKYHPLLNPFGSNGGVDGEQLRVTEDMLDHPSLGGLTRILMIHHHFGKYRPSSNSAAERAYHGFEGLTLKLHGKKAVEDTIERCGVSAVLHGHTHVEGIYNRSGIMYSSTALNTVKSRSDMDSDGTELSFNELRIDESGETEIQRRSLVSLPKRSSRLTSKTTARD